MQRDQGMPVVGYLMFAVFVPFALSFMASLAAFAFACIALIARALYFLKSGYWVHSACDATSFLTWYGINGPDACDQFSLSWLGVNYLLNRGLGQMDVSLFALLAGSALLIIGALGMMGFTALAQKFAKFLN